MKNSITGEDLSIRVNSTGRTSRRRAIERRQKIIMQALTSIMEFLGKKIQKYPSSHTRINAVSI